VFFFYLSDDYTLVISWLELEFKHDCNPVGPLLPVEATKSFRARTISVPKTCLGIETKGRLHQSLGATLFNRLCP
jgi:hypothetical protein